MSWASHSYLHMEVDSEWAQQGSQFRGENEAEIKGRADVFMGEHEKQTRQWLRLLVALRLHCGLQGLGHTPRTYLTQVPCKQKNLIWEAYGWKVVCF